MKQWIWAGLCWAGLLWGACGESAEAIRERTTARRPVIAALVADGVVEEASSGYLEVRNAAALGERRAVVEAENADRRKAYEAIAAKTGVSTEAVARRQAQRIRAAR